MSDTTTTSKRGNPPVMGEKARRACGLAINGSKRRKLLVLLAAYADGNSGACNPPVSELLRRIPELRNSGTLWGVVCRLADDGLIRQLPRGQGFELLFTHESEDGTPPLRESQFID